ncbi:MarR family winged helix-turn-helix transcriptional regulator [Pseudoroseomonas cervicalis]|uniref:MarR family winged helix-turn-helix transcriptional regulator n=1 Tax=Teichococcus cervicalis TaxID=204525 RepID=UPI0027807232|nr:MarR family winged helix-turn-helix transcriptional regulator [Pseudoroseomonas cervicalis]MDQ1081706.1 DNA-binding MarR family transcriptional regulator [Pseudoroseomonas cervicalis]
MEDTPPLDPLLLRAVEASCVCLRVQRASRAVGRRYDDAFRPLDLNNWQFSLLAAIEASEAPSVNALAGFLGMDRTTMTRNLAVLQRRGLLSMAQDAQDGRVRRAALTAQGRDLLLRALDSWRATNEAVKASIPAASFPAMWRGLGSLAGP